MKITNPYYYTIDEMKQIIAEWEEMGQIIDDYKASERIEDLTEEEFICLFGESTLYPNIYFADPGEGYDYAYVSDYDWYLLEKGFNPFTGEYFDITEWPSCHIIEGVDTINPSDVAQDLCWTDANLTFEEALAQATILDRLYLIVDDEDNIIGSGLFEVGNDINEYFRIKGFDDDYEFMKVEEPDNLNDAELEKSLTEDLEYYESLRTKTIDLNASDMSELDHLLQSPFHETVFRKIIQLEVYEKRFLIVATIVDEQYIIYKVFHELRNSGLDNLKLLGWDTYPESVFNILDYYHETGLTKECYQ
jgi:hypothetical protein